MPSAVRLREDYSAEELRALARRSKNVNQSRRLLSLAAVLSGMDRGGAAKIGGMDRQTLRDWIHRFNASGPEGLIDNWTEGPKPRLSAEQRAQFAEIVEAGPDREIDGVVRWRRIDLKRVIAERFGFSHISPRPRHPMQDERIVEGFKKTSRARVTGSSGRRLSPRSRLTPTLQRCWQAARSPMPCSAITWLPSRLHWVFLPTTRRRCSSLPTTSSRSPI